MSEIDQGGQAMTQPTEQDRPMSAIEDMLLKFTSGNDVAVQRAVVTLDEWRATYAEYMALQARVAELEKRVELCRATLKSKAEVEKERDGLAVKCAELVHYPACWDTVAYPALQDALSNIAADYHGCTECAQKALAKLKADAVREAHDWPVFFSQNSAGYEYNSYSTGFDDAMLISFARIKEIAGQMEAGEKVSGIMECNDTGIEFKVNQIELEGGV